MPWIKLHSLCALTRGLTSFTLIFWNLLVVCPSYADCRLFNWDTVQWLRYWQQKLQQENVLFGYAAGNPIASDSRGKPVFIQMFLFSHYSWIHSNQTPTHIPECLPTTITTELRSCNKTRWITLRAIMWLCLQRSSADDLIQGDLLLLTVSHSHH